MTETVSFWARGDGFSDTDGAAAAFWLPGRTVRLCSEKRAIGFLGAIRIPPVQYSVIGAGMRSCIR